LQSKAYPMRYLLALTALGSLFLAGDAGASPQGGMFQFELHIPDETGDNPDDLIVRSDEDVKRFFNYASCLCGTEFELQAQIVNGSGTDPREVEIWAGSACDTYMDNATREANCTKVDVIPEADDITGVDERRFTVDDVASVLGCELGDTLTHGIYYMIDDDVSGDANWACVDSQPISIDLNPPPAPTGAEANPGEGAINITWTATNQSDIRYYQALCKRAIGDPVAGEFGDAHQYLTARTQCGLEGRFADSDPNNPLMPAELARLDPAFVCGTSTGTETSMRIEGLQDMVSYHVALVAIDDAGNPSDIIYLNQVTPQPVRDFWEHYRAEGGQGRGGVCLATSTYGDDHPFTTAMRDFRDDVLAHSAVGRALIVKYYDYVAPLGAYVDGSIALRIVAMVALFPFVILAAFFAYVPGLVQLLLFGFLAWRLIRRRLRRGGRLALRPRWVAGATALLVLAAPALASAQSNGGFDPYWSSYDDDSQARVKVGRHHIKWNFNLKAGPYFPNIDDGVTAVEGGSSNGAPYAQTFGDTDSLMLALDLERYFLYPAGQLGLSFSIGAMSASANAFQLSSDGTMIATDPITGEPLRANGEKTRFRLIPTTLSVVYRFTTLDDEMHIPLVPYGKLGLAYHLWWIKKPGGSTARVRVDPECVGSCESTRGLGASLGYAATLGIAIRAERIDKQAAVNLRNEMGIHHAGFFAELSYAKVDGFGSDKKLHVGDTTWYAGINFEF
jgi:hypothetical protein